MTWRGRARPGMAWRRWARQAWLRETGARQVHGLARQRGVRLTLAPYSASARRYERDAMGFEVGTPSQRHERWLRVRCDECGLVVRDAANAIGLLDGTFNTGAKHSALDFVVMCSTRCQSA